MPNFSSERGFTLLEIIVVFSLLALISGIGFVSIHDFNRRQDVSQEASNISQVISKLRSDARASIKPEVCGDLEFSEYRLLVCSQVGCGSGGDFEIRALCGGADYFLSSIDMTSGLRIGSTTDCDVLSFLLPDGTVSGSLPCEITIEKNSIAERINIDSSGNLTQEKL